MDRREATLERFEGCLLGGALGDALGYPVEFRSGSEILLEYGRKAPADLIAKEGALALISDDTQMTLFTAEGMVRAWIRGTTRGVCAPQAVVARAYLRWLATQTGERLQDTDAVGLIEDGRLHAQRAPGNTCLSALATFQRTQQVPDVSTPPNDSKGCGAVMRVAPIGLCYADRRAAFEMARDCGVITHGHPSGYWSAAYFAALVHDVARGVDIATAMEHADTLLADKVGNEEMVAILKRTRALAARGVPDRASIESLGGGWVGEEALAIALLCVLTCEWEESRAIEEALWRATAHSGDSDSTAAIAGNLIGAMVGLEGLPARWLARLELRDVIETLADHLYETWILGRPPRWGSYPPG